MPRKEGYERLADIDKIDLQAGTEVESIQDVLIQPLADPHRFAEDAFRNIAADDVGIAFLLRLIKDPRGIEIAQERFPIAIGYLAEQLLPSAQLHIFRFRAGCRFHDGIQVPGGDDAAWQIDLHGIVLTKHVPPISVSLPGDSCRSPNRRP